MPVVFNLSSWSESQRSIRFWLIDELRTKYHIPSQLAHNWVNNDELLPLLDGLDEVGYEVRNRCIDALNEYRQSGNVLIPLVVCSRSHDYRELKSRLQVNGAVVLQPITNEQIDVYLARLGSGANPVRLALQSDKQLYTFIDSPLMLNIITIAYNGMSMQRLADVQSTDEKRKYIFNSYIHRVFNRRTINPQYSRYETLRSLVWLASNMLCDGQSIFVIEQVQPVWLSPAYRFIYGFLASFAEKLLNLVLTAMMIGTLTGVIYGKSTGIFFGASIALFLCFTLVHLSARGASVLANGTIEVRSGTWMFPPWKEIFKTGTITVGKNFIVILRQFTPSSFRIYIIIGAITVFILKQISLQKFWWSDNIDGMLSILTVLVAIALGGSFLFSIIVSFGTHEDFRFINRDSIDLLLKNALRNSLVVSIIFGVLVSKWWGFEIGLIYGLLCLSFVIASYGNETLIRYYALRATCWSIGYFPLNYARFLDYCHSLIFLRKVGGGYIFIHRMLMEHFANMTDEDIERIVREVEAGR